MKVGLIIYDSIHSITGGYIYDAKLVEYLRSKGMVVQLFPQKKTWISLIRNNFSKKMIHDIIEFSPDVLLQDEMNFISLFILNKKIKKRKKICIISIVHLLQTQVIKNVFLQWITKTIEDLYLKSVDGFIFNSMTTKKCIKTRIGTAKKSLVAYPGKDRLQPNAIKKTIGLKFQDNPLKVIFIGNLFYNKGLHTLLQAISAIDGKSWQLSIVGALDVDIKYTRTILKLIKHLKLENNIALHGILNTEQLKQLLSHKHVLIVPSYYESFGIVYIEAMGAGMPVIACNGSGAFEIVEDTRNGFLIPPGDSIKLRECIIKLIQDRLLLKRMSLASLSTFEHFPTWDESMEKIHLFLSKQIAQ